MKKAIAITLLLFLFVTILAAQDQTTKSTINPDITGLYSFVHEGEFVQIEVNGEKVTGLVSCFKDEDLDKAEFIDMFFDEAKLQGTTLTFRTKQVSGSYFEFSGEVERGPAKSADDEGYWVVKGTLITHRTGQDGKVTEKSQKLTMKSFPQDVEPAQKPAR